MNGAKLGWLLGGAGSLVWLAILSVVWLVHGHVGGGALGLAVFAAGIAYLLIFAPWRLPHTPIRRIYLGFLAILLAGVAVAIWQYRQALGAAQSMPLLVIGTLFIPFFTLGRRSWSDMRNE